jgi:hypothetical protein
VTGLQLTNYDEGLKRGGMVMGVTSRSDETRGTLSARGGIHEASTSIANAYTHAAGARGD